MKQIRENFKKTLRIFGVKVDFFSMGEVVKKISEWIKSEKPKKYLVTPNPEIITYSQKDKKFREILNGADLAIPDGWGILWAMKALNIQKTQKIRESGNQRIRGSEKMERMAGMDLMLKLCQLAPKKGWKIGLIGGYEAVAEKTAEKLREMFTGINIVFAESGGEIDKYGTPLSRYPAYSGVAATRLYAVIPKQIDILFVAFGFPKQEYWIDKNKEKFPAKVFIPVGGAFDYISGRIKRAPLWMQKIGLEWLYRLVKEPSRIKRQIKGARFFWMVVKEKFKI